MSRAPVKVLGVDTSLRSTGVGVLLTNGVEHKALVYGTIKNPPKRSVPDALHHLQTEILKIIEAESPDCVAVEGIFFCRNVKTAISLGQARGVVLAACAGRGLTIEEYSPRSVKKGITGFGAAGKDQMGLMIKRLLNLREVPQEDAADALAIALCHAHQLRFETLTRTPPQ